MKMKRCLSSLTSLVCAAFLLASCGPALDTSKPDVVSFSVHTSPGQVAPGAEGLHCIDVPGPSSDAYVSGWHATRTGAHHVNVWQLSATVKPNPVLHTCSSTGRTFIFDTSEPTVTTRFNHPGAAMLIPRNTWIDVEIHYFNPNADPVTEDVAIDFFKAETHVEAVNAVSLDSVPVFVVPPHTSMVLGPYTGSPPSDMQLLNAFGHQHAHGLWETFSVDGVEVYRSDSWADPLHEDYSDMMWTPKTKLSWSCGVNNTTNLPLKRTNQVNTGEMCSMAGLVIGPNWMYQSK